MSKVPLFQWNSLWEKYFRYVALARNDGNVTSRVAKATILEENFMTLHIRLELLPNYIQAPTLIARATVGMLGPDRGFILPTEEADRMRGIIPGSKVIDIPDTNHYTIVLSEVFKQEATAFLEAA